MERSMSERTVSFLVYGIALVGSMLLMINVVTMNYPVWNAVTVAGFCGIMAVAALRLSRFVAVHATHAFLLFTVIALICLVPFARGAAFEQGVLHDPVPVLEADTGLEPNIYNLTPATSLLWALLIFIGLPSLLIQLESMVDAAKGEFLKWPLLTWLQNRMIPQE